MLNLKCLDVEREERQINYYKNKLEAAETKMRDYDRCFNDTEGSDLIKKLIDEKESQTMKIFQMSEKLKMMEEREERLKTEVQDAKDQAELLEFRVLELEEERDKLKDEITSSKSLPPLSLVTTPGHPGHLVTDDSGCNSSVSTEGAANILELTYQDFRKEKVADTKAKLQVMSYAIKNLLHFQSKSSYVLKYAKG